MVLTDKQLKTLLDFANDYNIDYIAHKHNVCKATIKKRLDKISKRFPIEFVNAVGIRNAIKRAKINIQNPISLEILKDI